MRQGNDRAKEKAPAGDDGQETIQLRKETNVEALSVVKEQRNKPTISLSSETAKLVRPGNWELLCAPPPFDPSNAHPDVSQAVDRHVRPQSRSSNAIITSARLQGPSRSSFVRDLDGPTTRLPAQWLVEYGPMGVTKVSFVSL